VAIFIVTGHDDDE